ncbi:unnamed protein product [Hermetia illucens]|uniref:Alpha-and gamma-adaptin-binding protein p34 n=1 Tax=Hermetia illucens TaxID=343691 RepID=A0A7R8UKZ8_HERIL|nr:alpha- and gamma-adaptin-binding protein p34 [Hermetia illucens]CAD7082781.1 unnamed protein product [Hermetia illucens]
MVKYPVILVVSEGQVSPESIIENIRKKPPTEDVDQLMTLPAGDIVGCKLHLVTKYYQTDLYLVPFKEDISLLPAEIQEAIEAVLIYFDSGKRSFSDRIPVYAQFLKSNGIELGILLCDRVYEDSNEGITYKEAKQASQVLDVIELGRKREEGEEDDPHDPIGYDEVMQALRSFIWSNVDMGAASGQGKTAPKKEAKDTKKNKDGPPGKPTPNSMEAELEIFEKLLTKVMDFKNETATMTPPERLAYAERIAYDFENLMDDDDSDTSDEGEMLLPKFGIK